MAHEQFETSLLRLLAAELWLMASMSASREMFGRSYFSLGVAEKTALDHWVAGSIAANFSAINPDLLRSQSPISGFHPQLRPAP